jgi:hypothetical protein
MRNERFLAEAVASSHDQGRGQRRDACIDVNHRTPREIESAELTDPSSGRPDPMRQRRVNEYQP